MDRDAAPVIAAEALIAHGISDGAALSYVQRTWGLAELDGRAAVAAGHLLVRYRSNELAPTRD